MCTCMHYIALCTCSARRALMVAAWASMVAACAPMVAAWASMVAALAGMLYDGKVAAPAQFSMQTAVKYLSRRGRITCGTDHMRCERVGSVT